MTGPGARQAKERVTLHTDLATRLCGKFFSAPVNTFPSGIVLNIKRIGGIP